MEGKKGKDKKTFLGGGEMEPLMNAQGTLIERNPAGILNQ
jgi:hypothetical protein